MAVGDTAAAAGAPVVPQVDDARNGWNWINKLADWVAARYPLPLPVAKGGTGATTATQARVNLGINRIQSGDAALLIEDDGRIHSDALPGRTYSSSSPSGSDQNRLAVVTPFGTLGVLTDRVGNSYLPTSITIDNNVTAGGVLKATDDIICAGSKDTVSSYGALHIDSGGKIGTVASAAKYKTDVTEAGLDVEQLLAIEPKRFRLLSTPEGGPQELGFIADDFEPIAPELVIHGEDGEIEGLHYERVTVALYAIARSLHAELDLERRRSDQLERRTDWLYRQLTGQPTPAAATAPEGT